MRILALAFVALLVGCAGGPMMGPHFGMNIESDPPGARVFWSAGVNEAAATLKNLIGVTPCTWEGECEGNHTFKGQSAFVYSAFVSPVVILTAEPLGSATNLWPQRQVFHCNSTFRPGDPIPFKVFFDLHRPTSQGP